MGTHMQEKQEMRHMLPPVGWLAYCRLVQAARLPAREQEQKGSHADAN